MLITSDLTSEFKAARAGVQARVKMAAAEGQIGPVQRRPPRSQYVNGAIGLGRKTADLQGFVGQGTGGANVRLSDPEIRNPLLSTVNFYMPYDRKTLNQWIRFWCKFDPYVGNLIDLHGEFPISDFHFTGLSDPAVQRLYDEQKERLDMVRMAFSASREEEALGECYIFNQWDDDEGFWTDYTILNPDLLDVKAISWGSGRVGIYTYDPPEELKKLVHEKDERVLDALASLDDVVLENLINGQRIPLDDFNMMAMVREDFAYEGRGTSPVLRAFKDLLLKDKLREAQYAIADHQIAPIELWKLGTPDGNYMPTDEDLSDFRQTLLAGRHDPLYTLVTHGAVNLELIGFTGKIVDIGPQMDWIAKQICIAMYASEGMLTGEGQAYSGSLVALKVLQGRYQSKRDRIVRNWKKKLFTPFSLAHRIYSTSPADIAHQIRTTRKSQEDKKRPLVPGIEWNFKLDLSDSTQRLQYFMRLKDSTSLPMKTLCEVLDLPYDAVKKALKDEEGTVFDPVYQQVRADRAKESGRVPAMGGGTDLGAAEGLPGGMGGGGGGEGYEPDEREIEPEEPAGAETGEEPV